MRHNITAAGAADTSIGYAAFVRYVAHAFIGFFVSPFGYARHCDLLNPERGCLICHLLSSVLCGETVTLFD